jgi:hypothetical protein
MGQAEKALVRAMFPHDFNDECDQLFKTRLVEGGVFNGRQVNPVNATAAGQKLQKVYRGIWISGIIATEYDVVNYPRPTHRNHLYDFLEQRAAMMISGGMLEGTAIEQGWINAASDGNASGSNDMANQMLLYKNVMFQNMELVRATFNVLDDEIESAYHDLLVDGAGDDGVDHAGAYRAKEIFYKGIAIIIEAKNAGETPPFPSGDNFTDIMRNQIQQFYTGGALTAWALGRGFITTEAEGLNIHDTIENFIDNIIPGDVGEPEAPLVPLPPVPPVPVPTRCTTVSGRVTGWRRTRDERDGTA